MAIRKIAQIGHPVLRQTARTLTREELLSPAMQSFIDDLIAVSYTHLRAHETVLDLVCRLLLEKTKISHIAVFVFTTSLSNIKLCTTTRS